MDNPYEMDFKLIIDDNIEMVKKRKGDLLDNNKNKISKNIINNIIKNNSVTTETENKTIICHKRKLSENDF